jgi:hypothetical protein
MGTEPYNVVPGKGMAPNTIVVSAGPSPLYIQVRGFDTLPRWFTHEQNLSIIWHSTNPAPGHFRQNTQNKFGPIILFRVKPVDHSSLFPVSSSWSNQNRLKEDWLTIKNQQSCRQYFECKRSPSTSRLVWLSCTEPYYDLKDN